MYFKLKREFILITLLFLVYLLLPQTSQAAEYAQGISWQVLNRGNPIDAGEKNDRADWEGGYQLSTLVDKDGNLTYFFLSSDKLDVCTGRYNKATKSWELWTFAGWSSINNAMARPLNEGFQVSNKFVFVPLGNGEILSTVGAVARSGLEGLDNHGSLFDFKFNGADWLRWSGGISYTKQNFKRINPHRDGAFGFISMVADSDNTAILLSYTSDKFAGATYIVAAKFQANASDSCWKFWDGSSWVNNSNNWSKLPYTSSSYFINPMIVNLSAGKYLVVFKEFQAESSKWCSMRYDDTANLWEIWTESGWQNVTAGTALKAISTELSFLTYYPYHTNWVFVANGSGASAFGSKTGVKNSIYELRYNASSETWDASLSLVVSDANVDYYRAAVDDSGNIWLVYVSASDSRKLRITKKTATGWQTPEDILTFGSSVIPAGIEFVSGIPVIFFYSDERLYAVSSNDTGFWDAEQASIRNSSEPDIGPSSNIKYLTKWLITSADGAREMTYGAEIAAFLHVDKDGYLYAPHTTVCNVAIFLPNYDPTPGDMDRFWGNGWGYIYFPSGVAADNKRGKIYISERIDCAGLGGCYGGRIQIWEQSLRDSFVYTPAPPSFTSNFRWPADLAVDEEKGILYVSDSLHNVIKRFDLVNLTGGKPTYLDSFGDAKLLFPTGIEVDASGNVYVVDSWHHCIRKYDSDKNLKKSWGSLGRGEGQFLYPLAIAIDENNNLVFVTDPYNTRIQVFDGDGNYKYQWRDPEWTAGSSMGSSIGGIATDNQGHVYVSTDTRKVNISGYIIRTYHIYKYNIVSLAYGDINNDGEITAYDAALTAQAAVGLITLTSEQTQKADVSGDGQVNAYDAALIAQKAVGLISKFPVE